MTQQEHDTLMAIGTRLQQIQGEAPGNPAVITPQQLAAIAAAVVAALPAASSGGVTAAQIADELAKRLAA